MQDRNLETWRYSTCTTRTFRLLMSVILLIIVLQSNPIATNVKNVHAQACSLTLSPARVSGDYAYGGDAWMAMQRPHAPSP